jgi:hypothetical protein
MKNFFYLLSLTLLVTSCQISENITINDDGSGTIEMTENRHEPSYMRLVGEQYGKEDFYKDSTYVFSDYIKKYNYNFIKFTPIEQTLFSRYKDVVVHIKKSSFDKEYKTTFTHVFSKVEIIPDLYKTEDYADDLENNYALTAEKHYYTISYSYDNSVFKRIVTRTNPDEQNIQKKEMEAAKAKYGNLGYVQEYQLHYNFPRKIKSVSNAAAKISEDKKALSITFPLSDCIANPEITQLEVVLE